MISAFLKLQLFSVKVTVLLISHYLQPLQYSTPDRPLQVSRHDRWWTSNVLRSDSKVKNNLLAAYSTQLSTDGAGVRGGCHWDKGKSIQSFFRHQSYFLPLPFPFPLPFPETSVFSFFISFVGFDFFCLIIASV